MIEVFVEFFLSENSDVGRLIVTRIAQAIDHITRYTCLEMPLLTDDAADSLDSYISFVKIAEGKA